MQAHSHATPCCCLYLSCYARAANVTLSFSYPVELAQLAKSLKVSGTGAGGRTVTVSPCTTAQLTPLPLPIIFTAYGATQGASSSPTDLLSLNSTCAVVKIVPGLEPGAAAVLRLPKGARYSPIAGPVAQDTDVNVSEVAASSLQRPAGLRSETESCKRPAAGSGCGQKHRPELQLVGCPAPLQARRVVADAIAVYVWPCVHVQLCAGVRPAPLPHPAALGLYEQDRPAGAGLQRRHVSTASRAAPAAESVTTAQHHGHGVAPVSAQLPALELLRRQIRQLLQGTHAATFVLLAAPFIGPTGSGA